MNNSEKETDNKILEVYQKLFSTFGHQNWWPGETKLEIIVGAVLTQNTAWQNVEKAIENLKKEGLLVLAQLYRVNEDRLAAIIRPSGYYNIKAKRLKEIVRFLWENGGIELLLNRKTPELRETLLAINGVGEETADSILLYAMERPVFVVDAYTKRIFSRLGFLDENAIYGNVKSFFEQALPTDSNLYNEYHALIVRLGKDYCRKTKPLCMECPIERQCAYQVKL